MAVLRNTLKPASLASPKAEGIEAESGRVGRIEVTRTGKDF